MGGGGDAAAPAGGRRRQTVEQLREGWAVYQQQRNAAAAAGGAGSSDAGGSDASARYRHDPYQQPPAPAADAAAGCSTPPTDPPSPPSVPPQPWQPEPEGAGAAAGAAPAAAALTPPPHPPPPAVSLSPVTLPSPAPAPGEWPSPTPPAGAAPGAPSPYLLPTHGADTWYHPVGAAAAGAPADGWASPARPSPSPYSDACDAAAAGGACVAVVQFKHGRAAHFACAHAVAPGAHLIVEGDRGEDLGMVIATRGLTAADAGLPTAVRDAAPGEAEWWRGGLAEEEREARLLCQEIVGRRRIPITIAHAEFQFDMRKLTFHYVSDEAQPTFRECLGDCYAVWKCRIWFTRVHERGLRRIVVRHPAPPAAPPPYEEHPGDYCEPPPYSQ